MIDVESVSKAAACAQDLSEGAQMFLMKKTLVNGWATSKRCHEHHVHTCIFGRREAMDDTRHYLVCPFLWPIVSSAIDLHQPQASNLFGRDICRKLSSDMPSRCTIQAAALAY